MLILQITMKPAPDQEQPTALHRAVAAITRDQRLASPSPNRWKNQHLPKQDAAFIPINPKTETMRQLCFATRRPYLNERFFDSSLRRICTRRAALPRATTMSSQPLRANAWVATYCARVRAGGIAHGKPIAVLAIHFDRDAGPRHRPERARRRGGQSARAPGRFNFRVRLRLATARACWVSACPFRRTAGAPASTTTAPLAGFHARVES